MPRLLALLALCAAVVCTADAQDASVIAFPSDVPDSAPSGALAVSLVRGDDGILRIAAAPPYARDAASAPVGPAQRDRWDEAWDGAKVGALIGVLAGGALIVAGLAADSRCNGCDNFLPYRYRAVAVAVAVPLLVISTTTGATVGYVRGDN